MSAKFPWVKKIFLETLITFETLAALFSPHLKMSLVVAEAVRERAKEISLVFGEDNWAILILPFSAYYIF